jgi:hypothetical protein
MRKGSLYQSLKSDFSGWMLINERAVQATQKTKISVENIS